MWPFPSDQPVTPGRGFHKYHAMTIAMDLTDVALGDAIAKMVNMRDTGYLLIAGIAEGERAFMVAAKFGLEVVLLPDEVLSADGWALVGARNTVWSPGA